MLKNTAKILIGLSIFSPVILSGNLFFPFITGKAIFFRVLIELALLLFSLHIFLHPKRKENLKIIVNKLKHPIVIALSLFVLVFIISSFTAVNPIQAFWSNFERSEGAFQLIHYYLFFILTLVLFDKRKMPEKLLLTSIISATYAAVYGLLQWIKLDPSFGIIGDPIRISGTLGNASYLAASMLFTIGFLLYFILRTKNLGIKIIGTALALFFVVIMLKTGTKGALLGFILGTITFLLVNIFRKNTAKWLKTTSILLMLIGIIFSAVFFTTYKSPFWAKVPVVNRQLQLDRAIDEFQPRIWSWNSAIQGFKDKPILGWGAENYPFVYDKYYDARNFGRESFFDRVHNLYLENLVSGGILLFISSLLVLVLLFRKIFQRKKDLWFGVLLAIPIAYIVQAFFLFDVLVIYLSLYLFIALALNDNVNAENGVSLKIGKTKTGLILGSSLFLLINTLFLHISTLVIPILLFLAIIIFYEKTDQRYFISIIDAAFALMMIFLIALVVYTTAYKPLEKNKALVSTFSTNDIAQKLSFFQKALDINSPIGQEEVVGVLDNFVLTLAGQLEQNPESVSIPLLQGTINFSNSTHDKYSNLLPGLRHDYTNGGYNIRLGFLYSQQPLVDRGKQIYYSALEKSPTRIEFLVLLLEVARVEGNKEEYERLRRWAIELRPDLADTWPSALAPNQ